MTSEKAKDFFSAYFEGTLEPGLCVSFEQKLKGDGGLRHEYDAFVQAMGDLDTLKFEEIEIPHDLHERISARLDRHLFEKKRTAGPVWTAWLKGFAVAGIGAVAILGAVLTINARGRVVTDGLVPIAQDPINYSVSADGVMLKFAPSTVKTLVITNEGKEVSRATVGEASQPDLSRVLSNPWPKATVFGVQIEGETSGSYVALPGKLRSSATKGEGTVVDLARAACDFFRLPVTLETRVPNARISWSFASMNAVTESSRALGPNYSVTLLKNGMLEIEQK